MIQIVTKPATSQYGSHMGTCYHFPAFARATDTATGGEVELTGDMYPDLSLPALAEKAVAILRNRGRGKF